MNRNELREGIYVLVNNNVRKVLLNDILKYTHTGNDVKAIPLTDEWLVNFGLNENIYSQDNSRRFNFTNDDRFVIHIHQNNMHEVSFQGNTLVYIDYVHQLQNLYFTLKGEELIINL